MSHSVRVTIRSRRFLLSTTPSLTSCASLTVSLPRRLLSTKVEATAAAPAVPKLCWKCSTPLPAAAVQSALFCSQPACSAIQPLNPALTNHYELFALPRTFAIDLTALEAKFKALQRLLHPDKFATRPLDERNISSANSSLVNQAYQVLRSRIERTNYLLTKFHGIHVLEEGGTYKDTDTGTDSGMASPQHANLMLEMFELRERVEELSATSATDRAEAIKMLAETDAKMQQLGVELEAALSVQDVERPVVTSLAVHLKYLSKLGEELATKVEA